MTYKEIGTLAEIGAQVGDVVELVSVWEDPRHPQLGTIWEVDECGDAVNRDFGTCYGKNDEKYFRKFRIVSRAQPQGPVITETVTRKRIVAGVYGRISIDENCAKQFCISIDRPKITWKRSDLIAARDVFNQLIDAMGDE